MKIIKKFDQYIRGSIPEEELDDFTKEVVKEHFEKEELQEKWKAILEKEHQALGAINQVEKPVPLKRSSRLFKIGLLAAASILLLMLTWFVFQPNNSSPTYEKLLLAELDQPYIESITRKGSIDELRIQATASYNNRDYTTAKGYFEQLSKLDKAIDWKFYIGLCQLYQKESNQAIQTLKIVLEDRSKKYNIESNWYLGLAYLMNENFKLAKKHFEFVINESKNENAWKVRDAKKILDALP